MDGLNKTDAHVFLLAASNLPWDLDTAMLRRLEKRVSLLYLYFINNYKILIDMPDFPARQQLFEQLLPYDQEDHFPVDKLDYAALAHKTDGYSGADIALICKEAAMIPLRTLFGQLESHENESEEEDAEPPTFVRRAVNMQDVVSAISCTKPTCDSKMREKYQKWQNDFGST